MAISVTEVEFLKNRYQFDTSSVMMTRHNTRPQVTAKRKNGGKTLCGARMDRYLSFKKNLEEKSILVGENEPGL